MTEPDLAFIARQIERVLSEQREIRQDLSLLREELRVLSSRVGRMADTVHHDMLDRIRRLEDARGH
jgi:hypothetical protein